MRQKYNACPQEAYTLVTKKDIEKKSTNLMGWGKTVSKVGQSIKSINKKKINLFCGPEKYTVFKLKFEAKEFIR